MSYTPEILVKRRYGKIGNIIYSLVAYKESNKDLSVRTNGVVVKGELAWILNADVPEFKFTQTLVLIMEKIAKLSSFSN